VTDGNLNRAIQAANAARGFPERSSGWAKVSLVLAMARTVRRYSFNRYH
jgi:hypothetical protein